MSIKKCFEQKTKKNSSGKNAAYYNKEKTMCIATLAVNPSPTVREAVASNEHTPVKILTEMLANEQDRSVLRAVLLNDRLPRKAAANFVADENDVRVSLFDDDQELIEHFQK